jgi:prevent-host-death family protein
MPSTAKTTPKAVVNMHEAKTHLSRLVERVESGEEIIIGRAGKPVARLVPYQEKRPPRTGLGAWKGRVWIADDFEDDLPAEILEAFEADL